MALGDKAHLGFCLVQVEDGPGRTTSATLLSCRRVRGPGTRARDASRSLSLPAREVGTVRAKVSSGGFTSFRPPRLVASNAANLDATVS